MVMYIGVSNTILNTYKRNAYIGHLICIFIYSRWRPRWLPVYRQI